MIPGYVKKHGIDLEEYGNQKYRSFAEFFARKKKVNAALSEDPQVLISPCDGMFSVYPISEHLSLSMKESKYRIRDLVNDPAVAGKFAGGLCLVFRLRAHDYHHFCAFDDTDIKQIHYIPGQLHSVQPIACETVPVYRLNRRWWSLLETGHFGTAVQIEVGAMAVGGVRFQKKLGHLAKGTEMGNFELAGSTILLLLDASARKRLELYPAYQPAMNGETEVPAAIGEGIGVLKESDINEI